jgi:hypothetical protein
MLIQVHVDCGERRDKSAPIPAFCQHIKVDRLKEPRVALDRPVDDIPLPDFSLPDDFRVRHAVGGSQHFLRGQFEVPFDFQPFARMKNRMDCPGREGQQLTFLVFCRDAVGFLEPASNGRIVAVDDLALREEIAGERSPRRSFDHLLEASAGNYLGVDVDAVLNQNAEYPLVITVAQDASADAVRLDDPHSKPLALPDGLGRETAVENDSKNVTILGDSIDELVEGSLKAREFFGIGFLRHGCLSLWAGGTCCVTVQHP